MQIKLTAALAIAILNFTSGTNGHCVIIDAVGNAPTSSHCMGMGADPATPRNGVTQPGFQEDTPVFASPAVPWTKPKCQGYDPKRGSSCCKSSKCWPKTYYSAVKRVHVPSGCGVTLGRLKGSAKRNHPVQYAQPWNKNTFKNVYYYQQPVPGDAWINTSDEINQRVNTNSMPVVTAGGWLKLTLHQINSDGGGPFACTLDPAAAGGSFPIKLKVTTNVPGNAYSINKYSLKKWPIVIQIPAGIQCSGSFGGQNNICIVRCQNKAQNGPFGGCVPIQIYTPPPPPPPAPENPEEPQEPQEPQEPPAPVEPPSYDNNAGYQEVPLTYKDGSEWNDDNSMSKKRDVEFMELVARELDEPVADDATALRFHRD